MKKIGFLILIVIAIGLVFLFFRNGTTDGYQQYSDTGNKVAFHYPIGWQTSRTDGFVTLWEDQAKSSALKMIVTVGISDTLAEISGFLGSEAKEVVVGGKTVKVIHKDYSGTPNSLQNASYYYWKDASGRGYKLEIMPWQRDSIDPRLEQIMRTLHSI